MNESSVDPRTSRPSLDVAVVMRHERIDGPASRWQSHRWVLDSVVRDEPGQAGVPRCIERTDAAQRWLHGGISVALYRDEAEGYHLNATTPAPAWFVMWRLIEGVSDEIDPMAVPHAVTLSYNEGGRWLDAQETVEQVPLPPEVLAWLRTYTHEHYVVEPKRRKRPDSFVPLVDRFGKAASVSTEKKRGGGGHG